MDCNCIFFCNCNWMTPFFHSRKKSQFNFPYFLVVWQIDPFFSPISFTNTRTTTTRRHIQFSIIVVFINYLAGVLCALLLYLSFGNLSFSSHLHEIVVSIPLSSSSSHIIQGANIPTWIFFFFYTKKINQLYLLCLFCQLELLRITTL